MAWRYVILGVIVLLGGVGCQEDGGRPREVMEEVVMETVVVEPTARPVVPRVTAEMGVAEPEDGALLVFYTAYDEWGVAREMRVYNNGEVHWYEDGETVVGYQALTAIERLVGALNGLSRERDAVVQAEPIGCDKCVYIEVAQTVLGSEKRPAIKFYLDMTEVRGEVQMRMNWVDRFYNGLSEEPVVEGSLVADFMATREAVIARWGEEAHGVPTLVENEGEQLLVVGYLGDAVAETFGFYNQVLVYEDEWFLAEHCCDLSEERVEELVAYGLEQIENKDVLDVYYREGIPIEDDSNFLAFYNEGRGAYLIVRFKEHFQQVSSFEIDFLNQVKVLLTKAINGGDLLEGEEGILLHWVLRVEGEVVAEYRVYDTGYFVGFDEDREFVGFVPLEQIEASINWYKGQRWGDGRVDIVSEDCDTCVYLKMAKNFLNPVGSEPTEVYLSPSDQGWYELRSPIIRLTYVLEDIPQPIDDEFLRALTEREAQIKALSSRPHRSPENPVGYGADPVVVFRSVEPFYMWDEMRVDDDFFIYPNGLVVRGDGERKRWWGRDIEGMIDELLGEYDAYHTGVVGYYNEGVPSEGQFMAVYDETREEYFIVHLDMVYEDWTGYEYGFFAEFVFLALFGD
ncbi:MAG TPA: hypothetical protein VLL52_17365 [Anaerolineae bacterium]|nr:hypothetical protein [Anaerolineae bacterium]